MPGIEKLEGRWIGRTPYGVDGKVDIDQRLYTPNTLMADAVTYEPVSTPKFPANREINREFRRIRTFGANLKADTRADVFGRDSRGPSPNSSPGSATIDQYQGIPGRRVNIFILVWGVHGKQPLPAFAERIHSPHVDGTNR